MSARAHSRSYILGWLVCKCVHGRSPYLSTPHKQHANWFPIYTRADMSLVAAAIYGKHANRCSSRCTTTTRHGRASYQINESVQRRRHTMHIHTHTHTYTNRQQSNTFVNFAFIQIEFVTQPFDGGGGNSRECTRGCL